jgi:hypothetical protein
LSASSEAEETEKEDTTEEECPPPSWNLKEGNVPSGDKFPILQQFGIPIDNEQTTKLLLLELQKAQEAQEVLPTSSSKCLRMPNSADYISVPKGSSACTQ